MKRTSLNKCSLGISYLNGQDSQPPSVKNTKNEARLFWLLQGCGWIVFGGAMFTWGLEFMSPSDAFANKCLLVVTGLMLTLFFRLALRKLRNKSRHPIITIVVLLMISFTGALVWRETHTLLFQIYRSVEATGNVSARLVWIPLGTFLYDGFVLLAWSLLYIAISDWKDLEHERERASKAEAMVHAARLRALQSQLEPHFLFNTLNSISTLVVEQNNTDAAMMITRLSDFLRLTLATNERPEISLAEEFEFVRGYLEIQKIRFGARLRLAINSQPEAMGGMVPALLLQPLVENAVKHGVLDREEGGSVSVTAERTNGVLRLCVADNGPGIPQGHVAPRGLGLNNTAARLRELYGDSSRLSLRSGTTGGLVVMIEIPFRSVAAVEPANTPEEIVYGNTRSYR